MNVQIELTGFLITELIYKITQDLPDNSEPLHEEVEQKSQGRLAIQREFEMCIFEYETDLKTLVNDEVFRTLELSVQFHFSMDLINNEEDDELEGTDSLIQNIRDKFAGDMLSFIKLQVKEIVRQFTSIDYLPSINNGDEITFSIEF